MKIKNKSYNELVKEYRKLAKRADQRLVRIEGQSHFKEYKNIKQYAYKDAMKAIKSWDGKNAKRFNTKPPETVEDIVAKISDIKNFLNAPTSKVQTMKRQSKSLNETFYGKDKSMYMTWEEWANLWQKLDSENTDSRIDYNKIIISAGIQKKYNITPENYEQKKKEIERIEDIDELEKREIDQLMKQGLTYKDLFKS